MELFEALALWHLTKNGTENVFVCPQFSIAPNQWSCPDFVALNLKEKIVSVVEVSTASFPRGLLNKVTRRDHYWLANLKDQLSANGIIDSSWKRFQVVLYLREGAAKEFDKRFPGRNDVVIHSFEKMGHPWEWDWPSAKALKEAQETTGNESATEPNPSKS